MICLLSQVKDANVILAHTAKRSCFQTVFVFLCAARLRRVQPSSDSGIRWCCYVTDWTASSSRGPQSAAVRLRVGGGRWGQESDSEIDRFHERKVIRIERRRDHEDVTE